MGNQKLYNVRNEKNLIYAKPDFNDEDGIKVARLEEIFDSLNGWDAEYDAAILLNDLGLLSCLKGYSIRYFKI